MIPKSNLDDRTFDDIVAEAIRLIPRYCPEWTNHNPTDPGITLVELFAWMTEMTLYRLNQVPEKTYLSLLELMGLSLIPPQSARAVLQFFPVEGYKKPIPIKAGTQVAAVVGTDDTFMFETEQDVTVLNNRMAACINRSGERWTDFCTESGKVAPFTLFEANSEVEHVLYIASPLFAYLSAEHSVKIAFSSVAEILSVRDDTINFLYWEYWDGRSWVHLEAQPTILKKRKQDNVIYFTGPEAIEPCTVNGYTGYFLRAVLAEVPENRNTLIVNDIKLETYFGGSGFMPDTCMSNSGNIYLPVDMNTNFRIFSDNPEYNEVCYIAADEVFSKPKSKVTLVFTFSEMYVPGNENESALFSYEYWDGTNWSKLGESPRNTSKENPFDFEDNTFAFKKSGDVCFNVPAKCAKTKVNNEEHFWIRIRLVTKDFSLGGEYSRDEKDNWVWRFSSKVHSPIFSKIRITYNAGEQIPSEVYAYSNFTMSDVGACLRQIKKDTKPEVALFSLASDKVPSLYMGFSSAFAAGTATLFIKVNEDRSAKPKQQRASFFNDSKFMTPKEKRLVDLAWEYWDGKQWTSLSVNDYTDSFHESGFVEFTAPSDMIQKPEFSKNLYWLRIRFVSGSFEVQPFITDILSNVVYAKNCVTYKNEIAASGTGAPAQTVSPAHSPLLPGIRICINEGSIPPTNELDLMKAEGITAPYRIDGDAVWVQYKEVDNFYNSTPHSRHFVVDYQKNKIYFGDGERGINPPRYKFNICLESYRVGGGTEGNVAAGTLTTITQSVPFISGCTNPFPAEGGSDMETVDSLKSRSAGVFKSLQRAVTAEDFQWLSREASASVGRAWCLHDKNPKGEICIIVIPVIPSGQTVADRLVPSRELIRQVTAYLNERKLVGTKIRVQAPIYRVLNVLLTVVFKSDVLDVERLKKHIDTAIRAYFHPLQGSTGTGWEFGKAITEGAALKQLEKIEGILSIDEVSLFDADAGVVVDKFVLKPDELPYVQDITIENRRSAE